jgi:hypothetical protein
MSPAVVQVATNGVTVSSGTTATTNVTFSSATTPGSALVVAMYYSGPYGDSPSITSVKTNGATENWAAAKTEVDGNGGGDAVTLWVNPGTGGSQTVINVAWSFGGTASSTAQGFILIDLYEISGVLTSSVTDATAGSYGTGSTSWSSTATATTSQASEIAIGVFGGIELTPATMTVTGPSSPWTNQTTRTTTVNVSGTTYNVYLKSGYNILSSTGTVTYSGTVSSSNNNYAAAAVTLKGSTVKFNQVMTHQATLSRAAFY